MRRAGAIQRGRAGDENILAYKLGNFLRRLGLPGSVSLPCPQASNVVKFGVTLLSGCSSVGVLHINGRHREELAGRARNTTRSSKAYK